MSPTDGSNVSTFNQTCFVARQPIFDTTRQVFGYELLFRSGPGNSFNAADVDAASSRLIAESLSVFGLDTLIGASRAFVNFTRTVLLQGIADLLPPSRVVVEILETVEPDDAVVQACCAFKASGYLLALDDFIHRPDLEPLIAMADILKVDFQNANAEQRRHYAERYTRRGIKLLAEKVETWQECHKAAAAGYTLFLGYFFCRPEAVVRQSVNPSQIGYFRLLQELAQDEIDLD
jgi:EAL and modified HD-GYP domain-containing signal transduction protein